MKIRWFAWALVLMALFCCEARADIRVNVLARINELMDDASNRKMTQANKLLFMKDVGNEYGRRLLYVKRDTFITSANTETYAANSDFAGVLQSAYRKSGVERTVLTVLGRDSILKLPATSQVLYLFVETDGRIGVHALPTKADTIILLYGAYPTALSSDSTEWDLPNHYERPAYYEVAATCLDKVGTAEAQAKAAQLRQTSAELLAALLNPVTQTRNAGVSER